jgi:uncharacterized membrane protein
MAMTQNPALAAPHGNEPVLGQERIQSVDALRGAIMIVMALDHVRDYISSAAMAFNPTDLTRTTPAIFFTRWITHFCAPVFAFTAGVGAFFWLRQDRTKSQLSRFLTSRGLWLIVLELTVLRWIVFSQAGIHGQLIILLVIWMLGLSMIVLAGLVHLPARLLLALSLVVIATRNLFDSVAPERFGSAAWVWNILHQQGVFRVDGALVLAAYPLIPWFAVMAAGYCFGPVLRWDQARRQRFLVRLGIALSVAFIVIRGINRYGDPFPWTPQRSSLFTVMSFLNCVKYPPSLDFLLMTMGPAFLMLAWLERFHFSENNPLIVFGRVPLFYYVLHLGVAHLLAIFLGFVRYGWQSFLLLPPPSMGGPAKSFPPNFGYNLWMVYAVWTSVVVILYPVCRWYAGVKQRRHDWWLSYL